MNYYHTLMHTSIFREVILETRHLDEVVVNLVVVCALVLQFEFVKAAVLSDHRELRLSFGANPIHHVMGLHDEPHVSHHKHPHCLTLMLLISRVMRLDQLVDELVGSLVHVLPVLSYFTLQLSDR